MLDKMKGNAEKKGSAMAWMVNRKVEKEETPAQKQELPRNDDGPPLPFVHGAGYIKLKGVPFFATTDDVIDFLGEYRPSSVEHIHYSKGELGSTGEAFVMLASKQKAKDAVASKHGKTMVIETIEVTYENYDPPADSAPPAKHDLSANVDQGATMEPQGTGQGIYAMVEPEGGGEGLAIMEDSEEPVVGGVMEQPEVEPGPAELLMGRFLDHVSGPSGDDPMGDTMKKLLGDKARLLAAPVDYVPRKPVVEPAKANQGLLNLMEKLSGQVVIKQESQDAGPIAKKIEKLQQAKAVAKRSEHDMQSEVTNAISKMTSGTIKPLQSIGYDVRKQQQQTNRRDRSRSRDKKGSSASSSKPGTSTADSEDQFFDTMISKDDLVERVKEWRKSSEKGKRQWLDWVREKGTDGNKNPANYDTHFLSEFLNQAIAGWTHVPEDKAKEPKAHDAVHEELVQDLKRRERGSMAFKDRWAEYCYHHAGGHKDPTKHSSDFLKAFLDLEEQRLQYVAARYTPAAVVEMFGPANYRMKPKNMPQKKPEE
eukprot:gnl/MRDRNA2_/MRDRNA2_72629_c0_seq1.p1 gnl/MRDRNA2_/MRDRNA2_72629_c0~~gnl/MRDRNA2_/MRDRNA2_72629_c0_seq1.p1  ORF type:complete len:537 (-),score=148.46 gnl/MRDRNA2_/MRDRNA2_72629_c0_seq1:28-1638(-)